MTKQCQNFRFYCGQYLKCGNWL